MITTIIFDLAEVLLKGFYGVEEYLGPVLNLSPEEIRLKLKGPEFVEFMEGEITEDEFWTRVKERNKWLVDSNEFKKAIRNNFGEIDGTRAIIEKLRAKGLRLGLLSDHSREWIDHCNKEFDYHKLFHSRLYSFEVGCRKADRKIFELMLQKLDEKPQSCLFIDDSENNINLAKELGMNTIRFESPQQLKAELSRFSIVL